MISDAEIIIPVAETIVLEMETAFFVPEKTVGEAPAVVSTDIFI